ETRPRHLSPRTRETAGWETPAARATSRLGGRVLARANLGPRRRVDEGTAHMVGEKPADLRTADRRAAERPVSGGLGMATGYLEILRVRHAARLLVGTLVGRLPNATAAIAIVLFVRAEGGSYSLAGALAAVYGVANAVGQPVLGRLVDLRGQPRVQLPAAVLSALAMAVFAFAGIGPLPLAYAAVAAAGLFTPPLEGGLRAL